jgi:hypothetical protein
LKKADGDGGDAPKAAPKAAAAPAPKKPSNPMEEMVLRYLSFTIHNFLTTIFFLDDEDGGWKEGFRQW